MTVEPPLLAIEASLDAGGVWSVRVARLGERVPHAGRYSLNTRIGRGLSGLLEASGRAEAEVVETGRRATPMTRAPPDGG